MLSARLSSLVVRGHLLWLALILAWTGVSLGELRHLKLDGSPDRVMLKNDPERLFREESQETFGADEILMVVVPAEGSIYEPGYLERIHRLSQRLEELELVDEVSSLTSFQVIEPEGEGLTSLTVWERLEEGWSMEALRDYARGEHLLFRNVVSADDRMSAVNARVTVKGLEIEAKKSLVAEARRIADEVLGDSDHFVTGWPAVLVDTTHLMEQDLAALMQVTFAVLAVLLFLSFRRLTAVALPLVAVGLGVVWTMGSFPLTGTAVSIISNMIPLLPIAVGTAFSIYVLSYIFRALPEHADRRRAVEAALARAMPGVFYSGVTTMVALLALKAQRLEAIDEFGTFAAVGIGASMVMALVFVPSVLVLVPVRGRSPRPSRLGAALGRRLSSEALVGFLLSGRGRRTVAAGLVAVMLLAVLGISRTRIETAPLSWFPPGAPTREQAERVNEHLAGITPYNIVIDSGVADGAKEPELLRRVWELQEYLETLPAVDSTTSVVDFVRILNRAVGGGGEDSLRVPDSAPAVAQTLLLYELYKMDSLRTMVSDDFRKINVFVRSNLVSSERGVVFADEVNRYLVEHFGGAAGAHITGSAYLTYKTNLEMTSGLTFSLGLSMVAITVILMLLTGSVRLGLLAMIPNLVPIVANYGALGLTGYTLNAGTSITGCIAMGLAVDDTIHFLTELRKRLGRGGELAAALADTFDTVGRPMVTTTVCLGLSFGSLLLSSFRPIASLGVLVGVTMLLALLCDLLLLPVLLATFGSRQLLRRSAADPVTDPSTDLSPAQEPRAPGAA